MKYEVRVVQSRWIRFAIVAMLAMLAANGMWAQAKRPVRKARGAQPDIKVITKTIWGLEQKWLDALNQRDQPALDALLAPEFAAIGIEGRERTRAQELASVTDTTRPTLTRSIGRIDVDVYEAKVAVVRGLTIVNGDKIREAHLVYTHVWVLTGGKWKCVTEQVALENY